MILCLDAPSSVPETPDIKKPITAQERQREREEKRRRRQERAREKEKKQKEKERRDLKKAEGFGGLTLSENDKNLLERWTRMIDRTQHQNLPPLPAPTPASQTPPVPKPVPCADIGPASQPLPQQTVFEVTNVRCQQNGTVTNPSIAPNIQVIPRCLNPGPVPNLLHYVPPASAAFQIGPVVLAPPVKHIAPPIPAQLSQDLKFISAGRVNPFPAPARVAPAWGRGGQQEGWPATDAGDGKPNPLTVDPALFLRNPADVDQAAQVPGVAFMGGLESKPQDLTPLPPTTFSTTDPSTSVSPDINLVTQQFSRSQVRLALLSAI